MASIDYLKLPAEIRAALLVAASNLMSAENKKRPAEPGSPPPAGTEERLFACVNAIVEHGRKHGFFVDP